jgi:predicted lipid-binding transport protein (Tim44 family)
MKTIVYATSVLLIVSCQALVADSGSTTPPPPPTVDVTVNTTVDTTPIAQQMSSETTTMNNDFSGLSNAVGTVGSVLTGGFSSLLGGLFGGLFGGPLRVQDDKALFKLVTEVITTAEQLIQVKNQLKL